MTAYPFCVLLIGSFLIGSVIGAYFCTADYRINTDKALITAKCICPECGHTLLLTDQIPVISWLLLNGKCRYCGNPISVRYPLTEGSFMLFYPVCFAIFHNTPWLYLLLWYVFVTAGLILKCHGHIRSLIKGISIMTVFHLAISALYLVLDAAVRYSAGL